MVFGLSVEAQSTQVSGYWANCYNQQTRTTYRCFVRTQSAPTRASTYTEPARQYQQPSQRRSYLGSTRYEPGNQRSYSNNNYGTEPYYPVDHRQRTTTTRQDVQVDSGGGGWGSWGGFGRPRVRYRVTRIDQNVRIQSSVQNRPPYVRVGIGGLGYGW